MGHTEDTGRRLILYLVSSLALACSTNTANPNVALSTSREGVPPESRAILRSSSVVGDTLICEKSRRFQTANGERWLWVRVLRERNAGRKDADRTLAEAVVSTDAGGKMSDQKVELAGISLDGQADYTLRNTTGVRTAEPRESPRQAHRARAYTRGPDMGPVDLSCGGR
jgi:hypothetical protein